MPVGETQSFSDCYKMTGGYQKDALLEVYPFEKLGAGESVQYQYAILNSETMNKVICKDRKHSMELKTMHRLSCQRKKYTMMDVYL